MQCPECSSEHIRKNGKNRQGKQNHICVNCGRQFIEDYQPYQGYSDEIRRECLKMYVNGLGFRAIERIKGVHHTTVINWVKNVGKLLPDAYEPETIPQVGELDEMETFVGQKKRVRNFEGTSKCKTHSRHKIWIWTAVDHFKQGILGWVLGNRSGETFQHLWQIVEKWQCYFYVTDGWKVYPGFIPPGSQIICKTYMTRVEGENTRLRHYLARLHRKTLCYSKSVAMLNSSIRLLIHYLRFKDVPVPYRFIS